MNFLGWNSVSGYFLTIWIDAYKEYVHFELIFRVKFLGCRDPRWKHEYLDSSQSWLMTDEEEEVDESDKHI